MSQDDTTIAEEVIDTSTNDTQDTDDVALEDMEVSLSDMGATEEEEPEDEDEKKDEDTEPAEEPEEDEATETEEKSDDDTKVEETEPSDEDKQKALNKEYAEKRIQEKQAREQTQKEKQQDYLAEAEDDKDLAFRQLQIDAYENKVEGNSNKLTNGYERAIKDFDILTSNDPAIRAEVDSAIDSFQSQFVTIDAYGNPTAVNGDLYQYLQSKADSIARLTGLKVTNQKNSKDKEKSKILTIPSKAPKELKKDEEMDAFDEEASKY